MDTATADTDRLLRVAIGERRLVTFMLNGFPRIAEPHDYGIMRGVAKLFFYQVGGQSSKPPPVGWRLGELAGISQLNILDDRFSGPRPVRSGRHIQWDRLLATVSPRATS